MSLIVRHKDQPGVLAGVFGRLSQAGINVQETENIVFENAEAAIARINLDREPPAELVDALRQECPAILDVSLVALR